jgi:hypothetical protein
MFRIENDHRLPPTLKGPLLVDAQGLPRYWPTVWSTLFLDDLQLSTRSEHLRYIEALYSFVDHLEGQGTLDDMIGKLQYSEIHTVLEAYFITIKNQPRNTKSEKRWRTALTFVRNVLSWLSKNEANYDKYLKGERKLHYMETLFNQLHVATPSRAKIIRSLPASVLEALFELIDPASSINPFRNERIRWQVFVIFNILLRQGLRRGELLLLSADAIKSSMDKKLGRIRRWRQCPAHSFLLSHS